MKIDTFYMCKKMFGRKWSLQLKVIHRMYTVNFTYDALVWWKAIGRETDRKPVEKVQRIVSIGITEAIKNTKRFKCS